MSYIINKIILCDGRLLENVKFLFSLISNAFLSQNHFYIKINYTFARNRHYTSISKLKIRKFLSEIII